jgi:hypothetical protein
VSNQTKVLNMNPRNIWKTIQEKFIEIVMVTLFGGSTIGGVWTREELMKSIFFGVAAVSFLLFIRYMFQISKSNSSKLYLIKKLGEIYEESGGQRQFDSTALWDEVKEYIEGSLCTDDEKKELYKQIGRLNNLVFHQQLPHIISHVCRLIKRI